MASELLQYLGLRCLLDNIDRQQLSAGSLRTSSSSLSFLLVAVFTSIHIFLLVDRVC